MNPGRSLSGKVALVTDGSHGVGAAIVQRLANDGATVVFTHTASAAAAQQLVSQIEASGGTAIPVDAQCTAKRACEHTIATAIERFGRIDILVSNGDPIGAEGKKTDALSLAHLSRSNRRPWSMSVDAVISHMPIGGRIIATACAAAGDVNISLARALGARGITFNVVHPSTIEMDIDQSGSGAARTLDGVANLVAYLASEEASFITGAALCADGGHVW